MSTPPAHVPSAAGAQPGGELEQLQAKVANLSSLIEVSIIVNSTLDLDNVLSLVMEKAQAVMQAEASSVMLINEATNMLEWEVALGEVGDQVKDKIHLRVGEGIAGWVAQTGEPLIVPDVSRDARFSRKSDEVTGFRTRSILAAPLKVRNRIIGVAEVINPVGGRNFSNDDLELFSTFCRQVALAIENARNHRAMLEKQKLDQQLEAARTIQESFLPQKFPTDARNRFSVAAKSVPAIQIGGDFYDFVNCSEDALGVVMGDVSGKGMPAALYMAHLMSDFRIYSQTEAHPAGVLETINRILVERGRRGMFVTLQYILLDLNSGRVDYATGGHLPFLWLRQHGRKSEFVGKGGGAPLGILAESRFVQKSLQLAAGDYLIIFTDGVVEAKNRDAKQYSMERLSTTLKRSWPSPQALVEHLMQDVQHFTEGTAQHDDQTVVALRWG